MWVESNLVSGYPDPDRPPAQASEPIDADTAFLQKPFVMAELARTVRLLLDARRSPSPVG